MKMFMGLVLTTALLGAGCTTTEQDKYVADRPPPLAKGAAPTTVVETVKLGGPRTPVSADAIDDTNYSEMAHRLEGELKSDGRAMSKAGK